MREPIQISKTGRPKFAIMHSLQTERKIETEMGTEKIVIERSRDRDVNNVNGERDV